MVRIINKRMIATINKLSLEMTGGEKYVGKNNLFRGSKLDFVDRIKTNKIYGMVEFQTIFHQAAAYMYYTLKNHPFIDGNKRTGLATAITFLQWNEIAFSPFDENLVFDFVKDLTISDELPQKAIGKIAFWFQSMCIY